MVFDAVRYRLTGNQARLSAALDHAQVSTFLWLPSAVGLMAVGTPLLAAAIIWRRWIGRAAAPAPYLRTGVLSLVCLTVVYVVWALLMFGPAGAPTNVAMSYLTQLLMFCLGVMGWWAVSPRAAAIAVAVQSVVALWMFAIAPPYRGRGARPVPIHASMASLAIVAFAALVVCLWLLDRQSPYSIGGASGRDPEGLAPRPVTGGVSAHSMPAFRSSSRRRVGGGPLRRRLARHSHSRRSRTAEDEVAVCAGTVEAPPQDESRPAAEPAVRDAAPLRSPGLP
jgi:hypothetical protein